MADQGELVPYQPRLKKTRRKSLLTVQVIRFVEHLFHHGNATDAYLEHLAADPKMHRPSAASSASTLLKHPAVREYYRELQEHAKTAAKVNATRLVSIGSAVASADRTQIFTDEGGIKPPAAWPEDLRDAVESIVLEEFEGTCVDPETKEKYRGVVRRKYKVTFGNRLQAVELLMRYRKMLVSDVGEDGKDRRGDDFIIVDAGPNTEPPAAE